MFYLYAMYQNVADTTFWNVQSDVLLGWHYYNPVVEWEYNRTWAITGYQDDQPNPFVLDSILAKRLWFPKEEHIISVDYLFGWNLVTLSLEVEDSNYQTLFPNALTGTLYSFDATYLPEID